MSDNYHRVEAIDNPSAGPSLVDVVEGRGRREALRRAGNVLVGPIVLRLSPAASLLALRGSGVGLVGLRIDRWCPQGARG